MTNFTLCWTWTDENSLLRKKQRNHKDSQKQQNKITYIEFVVYDLDDCCPERDNRSGICDQLAVCTMDQHKYILKNR